MKKYLTLLALPALLGAPAFASDNVDRLQSLLAEEAAVEAETCQHAEVSATGATFRWTCTAKDACGKPYEGCGICLDHAIDKALAKCRENSREKDTCKVNDNLDCKQH